MEIDKPRTDPNIAWQTIREELERRGTLDASAMDAAVEVYWRTLGAFLRVEGARHPDIDLWEIAELRDFVMGDAVPTILADAQRIASIAGPAGALPAEAIFHGADTAALRDHEIDARCRAMVQQLSASIGARIITGLCRRKFL